MPSSPPTHMLRMSFLLSSSMITHLIISHFHFRSIFFQASHPSSMLYATAGMQFVFLVPWRCPGPLALVLFSTMVTMMVQCPSWTVLTIILHLSLSPNAIDWAAQTESNIPCITKRKPLFEQLLSEK